MRHRGINFVGTTVLFGVFFLCTVTEKPPSEASFEKSKCTSEDTKLGSAVNLQCGERNLTSVPNTTYDKPVSVLNISFNALKTLEEKTLLNYESVRYLYLQYCKIEKINENAFQRLENLTKIDLSDNRFTSISPNLFNGNQKLDKLILRSNNFGTLQWNKPILNGPSSLSALDLQRCQLSNISAKTLSLLPNLTFLDISRNNLVLLRNDTLSSHTKLEDVNLENNPWQCGTVFEGLLCWMHSKLPLSHKRIVKCQHSPNEPWDIWSPENRSLLCDPDSTLSVTSSHKTGISTSSKPNPARTPSHGLDNPSITTLNPEVPIKEEPANNGALLLWLIIGPLIVVVVVIVVLAGFISYRWYVLFMKPPRPNPSAATLL